MAQRDPATLAANLAEIERLRAEAGRTGPFEVTLFGLQVQSVDDVHRYEDAGATRLLVSPFTNPREGVDLLHRFGDEVISQL